MTVIKKRILHDLTDEIGDNATVGESPSWILEEGFTVRIVICLANCVDVVVVARIKYRIAKDEQRHMFFRDLKVALNEI